VDLLLNRSTLKIRLVKEIGTTKVAGKDNRRGYSNGSSFLRIFGWLPITDRELQYFADPFKHSMGAFWY